jgi:hypothetical protein
MVCIHGLPDETCPYCQIATRVKPTPQLVHPKPTDLPIDFPAKSEVVLPKTLTAPDLFQTNMGLNAIPQSLQPGFNVKSSNFEQPPSLLQERLKNIHNRWGTPEDISNLQTEIPIEDVKKRFQKS